MNLLTPEQIQHFYEKGWVGPLDAFSFAEAEAMKNYLELNGTQVIEINGTPSLLLYNNIYNQRTIRDHHLFHQPLADFLKHENIIRYLNQIIGQNVLLWRSDIFKLLPHQGLTKWHQYQDYYWMGDLDYQKQTLKFPQNPVDHPELSNLTVWIALTDAPAERGCLQFANGTHKHHFNIIKGAIPAEEGAFANYGSHRSIFQGGKKTSSAFEFNPQDWEIETVPVKAGQILIFTENVMHCSLPNLCNEPRIAINGSYIHPSVMVYPHRLQGDFIDQNSHNIQRHFCLLVSGTDPYQVNVVRESHDLDEIETEFQLMSNLVRYDQVELPQNKQQFQIYGLEKQALEGDCQESEPDPILHPRKYIQWQAWKSYQGMSQREAMKQYSQLVATLPRKVSHPEMSSFSGSSQAEIQNWLIAYLSEALEISSEAVDTTANFEQYGFDSMAIVNFMSDLEDWLGCELEPTVFYDYGTIQTLSEYLAQATKSKAWTVYSPTKL